MEVLRKNINVENLKENIVLTSGISPSYKNGVHASTLKFKTTRSRP